MSTATQAPVKAEKLTVRNYLGYAAGDAANNLSFSMAGMFLALYYTNVVGVEATVIGFMFFVVRFVDAVTDLATGRIVDAKKSGKMGKFRPFIFWFAVPLMVSSWLIYSANVFFPDMSNTMAIVYMYATYLLMGSIFYTLVNIPYGSMAPAMTQDPQERSKLASFRMYGAAVSILGLAFVVAPQIKANADNPDGLQQSLFVTTGIFVFIGAALYFFLVFNTKEQVQRDPTPVSFVDSLKTLGHNKPLLILSGSAVFFLAGFSGLSFLASYVALYVQGDGMFIAYNQVAQTASLFVIGPMIPKIVRTIGKKMGYMILCGITVLGGVLLAFLPITGTPWLGVVAFFVMGLGTYGVNTLMWALEADTVEYGEWKSGSRTEGTTYAVFSFTRKMGQAIGGWAGGVALTTAGFVAASVKAGEAVTAETSSNIQLYGGLLVAAAGLVALLVMAAYPLTESKFKEITAQIAQRRATVRPS